tara:strand:- start:18735 stop:19214 length:480 start_codon:yes stop_codon:yes gene_type:complete
MAYGNTGNSGGAVGQAANTTTTVTSSITKTDMGFGTKIYRGFSSKLGGIKSEVSDMDLIKQDLLNHFYTRKGERLMSPEFGSIIQDMVFEPLDEDNKELILEDVKNVVESDPRLILETAFLDQLENGLRVNIQAKVKPGNKSLQLSLDFETEASTEAIL